MKLTNDHGKKVLSLIVYFFNDITKLVVLRHLDSVELITVDAASLFKSISYVIEEKAIPCKNLISVLFDSCNVMRGCHSGVEVLLKSKAPHLLDIDGDSCHHIHNVAKSLLLLFNGG